MLLHVDRVQKRYGPRVALAGVSLTVAPGETVVVMGPSGCGKSTLLRCINRLTDWDAGEIYFAGKPIGPMDGAAVRALRRQMGFVFQHFHLIERLTVLDNVLLGLVLGGMPRDEAEERARAALARVHLAGEEARRPAELSGGQRQRVAIARALALDPPLMLWDEPTAALDPILVAEVLEVMEDLARSKSTGMLVVTHEVGFALRAADRVVLLEEGAVVDEGPPEQVFGRPRTALAQRYARLLAS
ncbi:MAG TPA: amino acid ABC transporter ATP-binding protein [Limnochordales bacterium]|nr:amino acid ABC transporter ATP-binding protein [Limnochordales bacterium]